MNWILRANLKRKKARLALTVAGIAVGVATLFALLSFSAGISTALERELDGLGAHVLVLPIGCPYSLTLSLMQGADTIEYISEDSLPGFRAVDNVEIAAPVVVGRAKVNGTLTPVYGSDIQTADLKHWDLASFDGAVVGSKAAADLGLSVGDTVNVSLYAPIAVPVIKILPVSGGRDDTFVFLPLEDAQLVLGLQGKLAAVLVRTADVSRVSETRTQLGHMAGVQAIPPNEVFDTLVGILATVRQTMILIAGIAIAVGVFTTMNTMIMSVQERRRDIGLLRAVGATRREVFDLFLTESIVVSAIGGVVGLGIGYLATLMLPRASGMGLDAPPQYSLAFVGICLLVAIAVGAVSAVYPAMMAARIQPIRALREL
jgi:putative ABC transport system permease protein